MSSPAIEMYQKDIEELEKLINIAVRPNIKRQLIEYKNNLSNLLKEENKKLEAEKKKKEESKSEKSDSTNDKDKSSPTSEVDPATLSTSLLFTTISKYAFDTSNEKYIKLYLTDGFEGIKTFNSYNINPNLPKLHSTYAQQDGKIKTTDFPALI